MAYKGFPIDTGSVVALKLLNPDNAIPACIVSSNMYSDRAEIIVEIDHQRVWLLFDEEGRFTHEFEGKLTDFQVNAGINRPIHRIDGDALPEPDEAHRIDVGLIGEIVICDEKLFDPCVKRVCVGECQKQNNGRTQKDGHHGHDPQCDDPVA